MRHNANFDTPTEKLWQIRTLRGLTRVDSSMNPMLARPSRSPAGWCTLGEYAEPGWMHAYEALERKMSKNFAFHVLQDSYGNTQVVARASQTGPSDSLSPFEHLNKIPLQSVVAVRGVIQLRLPSAFTPVCAAQYDPDTSY